MGSSLPLVRLRADAERHRGSLGASAPASRAGIDRDHRRFARLVRLRSRRARARPGQRPVQLALAGSCAYPVLADLANDEHFHGTIICSVVPLMFFAPGRFAAGRERRRKRCSVITARPGRNASAIEISIPLEEEFRLSKTGRPHARRVAQRTADPQSAERASAAAIAAVFLLDRSRTPRADGRAMRAARPLAGDGEERLARALHAAAAAELCSAEKFSARRSAKRSARVFATREPRSKNSARAAAKSFSSVSRSPAN